MPVSPTKRKDDIWRPAIPKGFEDCMTSMRTRYPTLKGQYLCEEEKAMGRIGLLKDVKSKTKIRPVEAFERDMQARLFGHPAKLAAKKASSRGALGRVKNGGGESAQEGESTADAIERLVGERGEAASKRGGGSSSSSRSSSRPISGVRGRTPQRAAAANSRPISATRTRATIEAPSTGSANMTSSAVKAEYSVSRGDVAEWDTWDIAGSTAPLPPPQSTQFQADVHFAGVFEMKKMPMNKMATKAEAKEARKGAAAASGALRGVGRSALNGTVQTQQTALYNKHYS
jgi:hypothetical protein